MRDIARSLDVVPSVIYHYYPQKDDLCDAVVEEVCSTVELPDADLGWKEWFTALLTAYRPVFLRCPGVTDRLAMGRITDPSCPSSTWPWPSWPTPASAPWPRWPTQ